MILSNLAQRSLAELYTLFLGERLTGADINPLQTFYGDRR